jgi:hypothetical protein
MGIPESCDIRLTVTSVDLVMLARNLSCQPRIGESRLGGPRVYELTQRDRGCTASVPHRATGVKRQVLPNCIPAQGWDAS